MQTAGYAQLNVRMHQSLKDEGTLALKSKGYTPATFIRGIWRRLASRGEDLNTLARLADMDGDAEPEAAALATASSATKSAQPPLCRGDELWDELLSQASLDSDAVARSFEELPYRDLLSLARMERFGSDQDDSVVGR